jgi:acyl carrier protein
MTREDIRQAVVKALTSVAPEIDPATLSPDLAFRQELELDSMDFLNFVIALHTSLGLDVPEADYGQLVTVDRAVDYLASRVGRGSTVAGEPAREKLPGDDGPNPVRW